MRRSAVAVTALLAVTLVSASPGNAAHAGTSCVATVPILTTTWQGCSMTLTCAGSEACDWVVISTVSGTGVVQGRIVAYGPPTDPVCGPVVTRCTVSMRWNEPPIGPGSTLRCEGSGLAIDAAITCSATPMGHGGHG